MKIGKVKKVIKRPDLIPVKIPVSKPIPAPDIFIKTPIKKVREDVKV